MGVFAFDFECHTCCCYALFAVVMRYLPLFVVIRVVAAQEVISENGPAGDLGRVGWPTRLTTRPREPCFPPARAPDGGFDWQAESAVSVAAGIISMPIRKIGFGRPRTG